MEATENINSSTPVLEINHLGKKFGEHEVLKDIVSGTILLAIGGIGGWFGGVIKGKKQSSMAVERKNQIYQPLLDEIKTYTTFDSTKPGVNL